jgi:nucleoside-diphosphate-sugar epimerase
VFLAAAKVAGFTGKPIFKQPSNDWENYANCHAVCSPLKAMRLLHWTPRHFGIIEDIEILFEAYKASNGIPL